MGGCCFKVAKVILFVVDFLLVLVSLVTVAIGIWALVDSKAFFDTIAFLTRRQGTITDLYVNTKFIQIASCVAIGVGAAMFIVSFTGCWGVVSESRCIIITYAVLMSVVVLLQIACVGVLFATQSMWIPKVKEKVTNDFNNYYKGTMGVFEPHMYDAYSLNIDTFMMSFKCCGINGPRDFLQTGIANEWQISGRTYVAPDGSTFQGDDVELPVACCQFNNTSFFDKREYSNYTIYIKDGQCPVKPKIEYKTQGCFEVVPKEIAKHQRVLITLPVVILVLELFCIIIASILSQHIKRWNDELYY